MITIKSQSEIEKMRKAGQLLAKAIEILKENVVIGMNCLKLEEIFSKFLKDNGVKSNFLNYHGYPKTICISINDQLVHGIPTNRIIQTGDIVSVDCGLIFEGYHADSAFTKICGISKNKNCDILVKVTKEALDLAISIVKPGTRIGDIGAIIQQYVESNGFSVPRDYTGHGIGTAMHEEPFIPNYGVRGSGMRLVEGMVIAIEPMVQMGNHLTKVASDKWTVYSADNSMTAHFEHTIAVTKDGCEVLTALEKSKKEA